MKRIFVPLTPIIAVALAAAAPAVSADEVPWNPYVVDRTVEVSPDSRKNKAFPMEEGSALCDLHLMAKAPWRIRSSRIAIRDDKTLWFKASDREYIIASGYAPNEYVVVRGELEKPGGGSGKEAEERPQFQVTVPKVDLQWAAKHGEASQEEKEDSVPAVIMVSEDPNDFGTLIVCAPKDDFQLSDPRVTLTWAPANAVRVYKGAAEVGSGVSWLLMAGTQLELSVKAVRPEVDVKFTLKGEPDVVSHERAVDYVRAMCAKVEFVTPAGDPVSAPKDAGDGQNEFTFSTASTGVLTMNLKAKVTPAAAAPIMAADCHFEVDAVGTSAMAWAAANPKGKATSNGAFLTATVAFTGLPDKNDAFGKKKAILLLNGRKLDENDYEVFFPKNATNHPGGQAGSPNWFYYWKEGGVCGIPSDCIFDPQAEYGWTQPWTDNIVRIGIDAAEINTGPETYTSRLAGFGSITTTGTGRGIKCVAETIQHEQHHLYLYKTYHGFGADPDSDGIPSLVEPTEDGVVSCPTNSDTYRLGGDYCPYGDNEVRCRRIEMRLTITIRPAQDWANPGCQSFSQFGPHP